MNVDRKTICFFRSNSIDPDPRVEKEVRCLLNAGYKVDIFCWDRESDHKVSEGLIFDNRVHIYKSGHKASFGDGFKNLLPYILFQFDIVRWIKNNINKYYFFHACDFDTAFSVYFAKNKKYGVFIFDIFDFICGNPKNLFERAIKYTQLKLINRSDATIICSEKRLKQIYGASSKKIVIIHNSPYDIVKYESKHREKITISYIGILQEHRLIKEMLQYFSIHNEFDFHIAGFGKYENICNEYSSRFNNIHFHGKISYDDALKIESDSDILTAIYNPSIENHIYAAPNKFYEALMLGKPLIMVKETGMSEIVKDENIGVLIDYSYNGFERGLNELYDKRNEWNNMSIKMQKLYREKYSWDIMSIRLIELYNSFVAA